MFRSRVRKATVVVLAFGLPALLGLPSAAAADTSPPSQPTGVNTSVSGSTVTLSWTASSDDVSVIGYEVHTSLASGFTPDANSLLASGPTTTYADRYVPQGTWYYKIIAKDGSGNASTPSVEVSATVTQPDDVVSPSQPTDLTATFSAGSVSLSWTASTDNYGVVGYDVHASTTAGFTPSNSTLIDFALDNEYIYGASVGTWYYRVVAYDGFANASVASPTATVTVYPPPPTPGRPFAVAHDTSATLVWGISNLPPELSAPAPEYVVTISPGGRQITTREQIISVSGLTNGVSYTFAVYARNNAGQSAPATSAAFTPADTVAPSIGALSVTPGERQAQLSWWIPTDGDVAGVTLRRLEGETAPGASEGVEVYNGTSLTVATSTGLEEGRTYTFAVWAHDEVPNYSTSKATLYGSVMSGTRSTSRVVYGGSVTHTTKLTRVSTAAPLGLQAVTLYRRTPGAATWARACSTTTSATGVASCATKPLRNTEYEWRFGGSGYQGSARAAAYVVRVGPKVTATASSARVSRGGSVTFSGSVSPRHAGQKVYLQTYSSGRWRNVTSKYLSATSTYTFRVRPTATASYRVYKTADSDHSWGKSPTRRVSVR